MSVSKSVVGRPTTVLIIFILVAGFGLYSTSDLAIDLFPEINPPVLILFSNYEGAGPEEIEKSVTRPLEGQLSNVSNIERISSTSSEGSSQIQLEFTFGTDMTEATNEVRDRLELVKDILPEEATSPQIFKFDPALIPILQLEVSGNRSPEELRELAVNTIQPRVEQIEGVALAGVRGGREQVVRVEIPQNRLEAYDLNFTQIAGALRRNNVQLSAGNINEGNRSYLVRTAGEFRSIEEIRNTVITYRGDTSGGALARGVGFGDGNRSAAVRLRDIANVANGYRDETSAVYINGEPGVFVIVQKQSGTNSVQVADNVINRLDDINEALPIGVELSVVEDTTTLIRDSLADVSSSAITGAVLAVLILFFLRSLRTTLIIAISIPVSIIVTLMLMYFAGLTLNLMTLTGLALGIGMLVDNSIVILENIYRYREKGAKLTSSAILGSQEMITAITASTLTTVMVFVPLALFRAQLEVIGELFSDLAFTVVISLLSSLAVAVFLIPVLTSRYLPISSRKQAPLRGVLRWMDDRMAGMFTRLDTRYKQSLAFSLRHKWLVIVLVLGAFVGSLFMIPMTGFEFTPQQEEDSVQLNVEMPIGTRLDITRSVLRQIEAIVEEEVNVYRDIIIEVGEPAFFGFLGAADTSKGSLTVILPEYELRDENDEEVQEILRSHFNDFPGAVFSLGGGGGPGGGGFNASPIEITLRSEDRDLMRRTGERIIEMIENEVPAATEPQMNVSEGLPEVEIVVDRQKAYELGLNISTIGQEVRANIDGITAGRFRRGGSEYDILLVLEERSRDQIPDLQRIFINNQFGRQIPLSSIAEINRTTGPVSISRQDQSRTLTVTAGLAPGETIDVVMPEIQRRIQEEIPSTDELVITYGGDFEDLQEYGRTFIYVLAIAVFLVFGVMASQFESFLDPFIILFTVPLTLVGVILLYVGTGTNFSLFTAVGLVVLVGIVVNNGIVLVDYTNLLRKRGATINDACVEAGGNRLRPILMTTLTTVLGLLPVAFAVGEGSSLVQPIAKTVVGGLTVATLLTLYLVPVIYAIFNRLSEKRLARRERRRERRATRRREADTTNSEVESA